MSGKGPASGGRFSDFNRSSSHLHTLSSLLKGEKNIFGPYGTRYFQKNAITSVIFTFHEGQLELVY